MTDRLYTAYIVPALTALILFSGPVYSQTAVHSEEDLYADFQVLVGERERPYLNYKTLSDSSWDSSPGLKIFPLELYSSYNATAPYGANDGALWQGKGLNMSFTGGVRHKSELFELTFKPQIVFSQNSSFRLMDSEYSSEYGYIWGYSENAGADAPQRFGNQPLYDFNWGDTEARFTWKSFTIGVGTQSPWMGPGRVNAIIHSNNAPPYPAVDMGLRRSRLTILGWYAGDVEARLRCGYLSESDYFDEDSSNDHNMISSLSLAYAPSFLKGLTLFLNRAYLARWKADSLNTIPKLMLVNWSGGGGQDEWDQRVSLGFDLLLPEVGAEFYAEAGLNDYPGNTLTKNIQNPFHSLVYTCGVRKSVTIDAEKKLRGEVIFEWSNLELSPDFQFQWPATFYMHHEVTQGHTNEGQWLGAGIGTGGNSQYLGFRVYSGAQGVDSREIYIHRYNPDNDFKNRETIKTGDDVDEIGKNNYRTILAVGVKSSSRLIGRLDLLLGLAGILDYCRYYDHTDPDAISWNMQVQAGIKYHL